MAMPKGHKVSREPIPPEDVPLTGKEHRFVAEYVKGNNSYQCWKNLGWDKGLSVKEARAKACYMLRKANVQAEIIRIMDDMHNQSVANATEVMKYFTDVMRGDVKDQFGLDAPLSERTRAAQELAKRTVDLENRRAGDADNVIQIKLDWSREG